jgi:hypothetical protein
MGAEKVALSAFVILSVAKNLNEFKGLRPFASLR